MKKFTEIGQFRNVVRDVKTNHDYKGKDENGDVIYFHDSPYPTYKFRGTIKLHGTNAGILATKDEDGTISYEFQSRERVLSYQQDNAGFMSYISYTDYKSLFKTIEFKNSCVIYGEWCGGNIQKGVALSELEKMFVIFAIRIDDVYVDLINYKHIKNEPQRVYNILDFPYYEIDIDFNNPELFQNKLIEITDSVENECPVGKQFGVSNVGEGVVWEAFHPTDNLRYIFKVKGEKHAKKSKVTTLKTVDDELINKRMRIAQEVTPAWRLEQMVNLACDTVNGGRVDRKHLGEYLKLIMNDIQKEDMDIVAGAELTLKDIGKYVSEIAKQYFIEQEMNDVFK